MINGHQKMLPSLLLYPQSWWRHCPNRLVGATGGCSATKCQSGATGTELSQEKYKQSDVLLGQWGPLANMGHEVLQGAGAQRHRANTVWSRVMFHYVEYDSMVKYTACMDSESLSVLHSPDGLQSSPAPSDPKP